MKFKHHKHAQSTNLGPEEIQQMKENLVIKYPQYLAKVLADQAATHDDLLYNYINPALEQVGFPTFRHKSKVRADQVQRQTGQFQQKAKIQEKIEEIKRVLQQVAHDEPKNFFSQLKNNKIITLDQIKNLTNLLKSKRQIQAKNKFNKIKKYSKQTPNDLNTALDKNIESIKSIGDFLKDIGRHSSQIEGQIREGIINAIQEIVSQNPKVQESLNNIIKRARFRNQIQKLTKEQIVAMLKDIVNASHLSDFIQGFNKNELVEAASIRKLKKYSNSDWMQQLAKAIEKDQKLQEELKDRILLLAKNDTQFKAKILNSMIVGSEVKKYKKALFLKDLKESPQSVAGAVADILKSEHGVNTKNLLKKELKKLQIYFGTQGSQE